MKPSFNYDPALYNLRSAEIVLPWLFEIYHPNSILDVGCGIGTWLSVAQALGVNEFLGLEMSPYDETICKIPKANYQQLDLNITASNYGSYDLCLCLEVGEHLLPAAADSLIDLLCKSAPVIIFSAAVPDQPGEGHVNSQWPQYWEKKFSARGFDAYDVIRPKFWNDENVDWWYRQNAILYVKSQINLKLPAIDFGAISLVHPKLYQLKLGNINELNSIKEQAVFYPSFRFAVKTFLKAIFKTPFSKKNIRFND